MGITTAITGDKILKLYHDKLNTKLIFSPPIWSGSSNTVSLPHATVGGGKFIFALNYDGLRYMSVDIPYLAYGPDTHEVHSRNIAISGNITKAQMTLMVYEGPTNYTFYVRGSEHSSTTNTVGSIVITGIFKRRPQ